MDSSIAVLLKERFSDLSDSRTGRAKRHELIDVVVIVISAVICGADSWVDVEMYGKSKRDWLDRFLSCTMTCLICSTSLEAQSLHTTNIDTVRQ